jgi:hypothetical protein
VGNIQIRLDPENGMAIDKSTGKAVELWVVSDMKIQGDSATANVYAHKSGLAAESYTVNFRHKDRKWVVESKKLVSIS